MTSSHLLDRLEVEYQAVLGARAEFLAEILATLYNTLTIPPVLVRAHTALDCTVDVCYRPAAFPTKLSRLEFLFQAYRQLQAPLLPAGGPQAKHPRDRAA